MGVLLVLLLAGALLTLSVRARGSDASRCDRFAAASAERAANGTGGVPDVLVIGDSWSLGLGLVEPLGSWPSRLPGNVRVAGFSGSGFSRGAGHCRGVSFAERAPGALRGAQPGAPDLVLVEGGLNDVGQPAAAIATGFRALMVELEGRRVVVIGPAPAPARAAGVARVDALLAELARESGVAYVPTTDLTLGYLRDGLHPTPDGHRVFGDAVARAVTAVPARG